MAFYEFKFKTYSIFHEPIMAVKFNVSKQHTKYCIGMTPWSATSSIRFYAYPTWLGMCHSSQQTNDRPMSVFGSSVRYQEIRLCV